MWAIPAGTLTSSTRPRRLTKSIGYTRGEAGL